MVLVFWSYHCIIYLNVTDIPSNKIAVFYLFGLDYLLLEMTWEKQFNLMCYSNLMVGEGGGGGAIHEN